MKKWFSWMTACLTALCFLGALQPVQADSFNLDEFGRLPVVFNGRTQPIDSLARNSLLQIREKQTVYLPAEKRTMPAIEWLAELMMTPEQADKRKIFRIDHPDLIGALKLPEKDEAVGNDGKHFSWSQIEPSLSFMDKESKRVGAIDAAKRNVYEQAVMHLHERLVIYMRLKNTLQPQDAKDWSKELADYLDSIPAGVAAYRAKQANRTYDEAAYERFVGYAQRFDLMARMEPPLIVPPFHPEKEKDGWSRMGSVLLEVAGGEPLPPAVEYYAKMVTAYKQGNPDTFNQAVADYRASLLPAFASQLTKASRETFFNKMQPFYLGMWCYVPAFLLVCGFWATFANWLRRSAVVLLIIGLVIHTTGLIFRMWLEGRPPVTNLYSSAIFIGWGAVILGLLLERIYKDGIGAVVASVIGFLTLIIAHHLSLSGDTLEMMRAVLDTNFWLATHVVVVTLGYASTFVAGFLGIVYIVLGLTTKMLSPSHPINARMKDRDLGKALVRMVYGIVCFATLFSFVGTVLGGIWADQSWGRFWGWDPKENGALIIVLWNALILHARWGGMVKERGIMNMVVFGNIVTAWSWFGVNMLGIGLHSYGFMDAAFKALMAFIVSQLLLMGAGLLPPKYWTSFKDQKVDQKPPGKQGGGKSSKSSSGRPATA